MNRSYFKQLILTLLVALTFAGSAWILQSCMPTTVTGVEIPHEEKIVIYASLVAGQPLNNIQITRTLPPLDTFNVELSRIENAAATITVDGASFPLRLQPRVAPRTLIDSLNFSLSNQPSLYEVSGLTIQAGKTYSIQVSWNGKQATASTRVPEEPMLAAPQPSVIWRQEPFRYVVNRPRTFPATGIVPSLLAVSQIPLVARSGEAYRIETFTAQDTVSRLSTTNAITLNTTNLFGSSTPTVTVSSSVRYFVQGDSIFKPQLFRLATASTVSVMRVYAHDAALLDFITTQARNSPNASPFGNSGQNPLWNIKGDGIGLFIGQSRALQVTVRP
ncbi:MAG: DUF4249 family protein [Candidatus Kapabacteria bacterium]|jgi:hypothetical protein|nr:DUF4249 family protein [Candidatus Kapabacteria bacterium]